jgi:hypothetical protein
MAGRGLAGGSSAGPGVAGRHHRCCRRRPRRADAGDGGPPAGESASVLADSGTPGEPAAFAVLPGSAAFRGVAGLAGPAKLAGLATRPGLTAPGRPARSRSPVPGLAAAASASAAAALATSSGCGRDTSLARIATSTVIFIVSIGGLQAQSRTHGCQPAPGAAGDPAAPCGPAARPLRLMTGIRWIAACPQERTPGRAGTEGGRLWR